MLQSTRRNKYGSPRSVVPPSQELLELLRRADPAACAEVSALHATLGAASEAVATALPAALCAAAPALERAVREDRARASIALCRAVLKGAQLLVRAMGEVA